MTHEPSFEINHASVIADLNDKMRGAIHQPGRNVVLFTEGVTGLIGDTATFRGHQRRAEILRTLRDFDSFGPDNDPHGERDFGIFSLFGQTLYWKIDYYNLTLTGGSDAPSNPALTRRVLTILLASEY